MAAVEITADYHLGEEAFQSICPGYERYERKLYPKFLSKISKHFLKPFPATQLTYSVKENHYSTTRNSREIDETRQRQIRHVPVEVLRYYVMLLDKVKAGKLVKLNDTADEHNPAHNFISSVEKYLKTGNHSHEDEEVIRKIIPTLTTAYIRETRETGSHTSRHHKRAGKHSTKKPNKTFRGHKGSMKHEKTAHSTTKTKTKSNKLKHHSSWHVLKPSRTDFPILQSSSPVYPSQSTQFIKYKGVKSISTKSKAENLDRLKTSDIFSDAYPTVEPVAKAVKKRHRKHRHSTKTVSSHRKSNKIPVTKGSQSQHKNESEISEIEGSGEPDPSISDRSNVSVSEAQIKNQGNSLDDSNKESNQLPSHLYKNKTNKTFEKSLTKIENGSKRTLNSTNNDNNNAIANQKESSKSCDSCLTNETSTSTKTSENENKEISSSQKTITTIAESSSKITIQTTLPSNPKKDRSEQNVAPSSSDSSTTNNPIPPTTINNRMSPEQNVAPSSSDSSSSNETVPSTTIPGNNNMDQNSRSNNTNREPISIVSPVVLGNTTSPNSNGFVTPKITPSSTMNNINNNNNRSSNDIPNTTPTCCENATNVAQPITTTTAPLVSNTTTSQQPTVQQPTTNSSTTFDTTPKNLLRNSTAATPLPAVGNTTTTPVVTPVPQSTIPSVTNETTSNQSINGEKNNSSNQTNLVPNTTSLDSVSTSTTTVESNPCQMNGSNNDTTGCNGNPCKMMNSGGDKNGTTGCQENENKPCNDGKDVGRNATAKCQDKVLAFNSNNFTTSNDTTILPKKDENNLPTNGSQPQQQGVNNNLGKMENKTLESQQPSIVNGFNNDHKGYTKNDHSDESVVKTDQANNQNKTAMMAEGSKQVNGGVNQANNKNESNVPSSPNKTLPTPLMTTTITTTQQPPTTTAKPSKTTQNPTITTSTTTTTQQNQNKKISVFASSSATINLKASSNEINTPKTLTTDDENFTFDLGTERSEFVKNFVKPSSKTVTASTTTDEHKGDSQRNTFKTLEHLSLNPKPTEPLTVFATKAKVLTPKANLTQTRSVLYTEHNIKNKSIKADGKSTEGILPSVDTQSVTVNSVHGSESNQTKTNMSSNKTEIDKDTSIKEDELDKKISNSSMKVENKTLHNENSNGNLVTTNEMVTSKSNDVKTDDDNGFNSKEKILPLSTEATSSLQSRFPTYFTVQHENDETTLSVDEIKQDNDETAVNNRETMTPTAKPAVVTSTTKNVNIYGTKPITLPTQSTTSTTTTTTKKVTTTAKKIPTSPLPTVNAIEKENKSAATTMIGKKTKTDAHIKEKISTFMPKAKKINVTPSSFSKTDNGLKETEKMETTESQHKVSTQPLMTSEKPKKASTKLNNSITKQKNNTHPKNVNLMESLLQTFIKNETINDKKKVNQESNESLTRTTKQEPQVKPTQLFTKKHNKDAPVTTTKTTITTKQQEKTIIHSNHHHSSQLPFSNPHTYKKGTDFESTLSRENTESLATDGNTKSDIDNTQSTASLGLPFSNTGIPTRIPGLKALFSSSKHHSKQEETTKTKPVNLVDIKPTHSTSNDLDDIHLKSKQPDNNNQTSGKADEKPEKEKMKVVDTVSPTKAVKAGKDIKNKNKMEKSNVKSTVGKTEENTPSESEWVTYTSESAPESSNDVHTPKPSVYPTTGIILKPSDKDTSDVKSSSSKMTSEKINLPATKSSKKHHTDHGPKLTTDLENFFNTVTTEAITFRKHVNKNNKKSTIIKPTSSSNYRKSKISTISKTDGLELLKTFENEEKKSTIMRSTPMSKLTKLTFTEQGKTYERRNKTFSSTDLSTHLFGTEVPNKSVNKSTAETRQNVVSTTPLTTTGTLLITKRHASESFVTSSTRSLNGKHKTKTILKKKNLKKSNQTLPTPKPMKWLEFFNTSVTSESNSSIPVQRKIIQILTDNNRQDEKSKVEPELVSFLQELMKKIDHPKVTTEQILQPGVPKYKLNWKCRLDGTPWSTAYIIGMSRFLQSHGVRCKENEFLQEFQLVDNKDQFFPLFRYNYKCCQISLQKPGVA